MTLLTKSSRPLYASAATPPSSSSSEADLSPRDRKRVQTFLENLIEAGSPSKYP